MPRVSWDIDASDVDEYDRSSQFKPYDGPEPKEGIYLFAVKVLKQIPKTGKKNAQLRVGLELVPRAGRDEREYADYFRMAFLPITPNTAFRYVPFLDAIGVSGTDFTRRTLVDEEGNVKKIGKYVQDGQTMILARLKYEEDQHGDDQLNIVDFYEAPDDVVIDEGDGVDDDGEYGPNDSYDEEMDVEDDDEDEEVF